ncbi:SRPBCC family protein [Zafaria sp. Z1313]|uniref:SRPBCC family protein n=1 Tax=unclassified Zafaria TaxID=2828765 RepID=UPI002E7828DB|nr:SRPBCC family protein [Zafaria sp. J156]MEE1621609.1 SRPBCC family protein [Zafaria sp. J156]
MAWTRTQEHYIERTPEQLWDVLADPARLPEWNPAVASLTPRPANGPAPLGPGTELDLVPRPAPIGEIHRRTAPAAVVTRCDAPHAFAWRQQQPGGGLLLSWELTPAGTGTLLSQRVSVDGAASALFAETAARPLASRFAENCARLYRLAGGTVTQPLKVVIAGGTGFLGRRLAADLLCRGHEVVVLSRRPDDSLPFVQRAWDGRGQGPWAAELAGETALVNLAGKLVDCPPTTANIEALRASRVDSTRALVEASRRLDAPLRRWVQASTTAVFGDSGDARLTEDSPLPRTEADGALPQMTGVARPWEEAAAGANAEHLSVLRTSIVLEQECPAFDRLALLARAGLGGPVGDGAQWFSWIHLEDWLGIARAALGLEAGVELGSGVVIAAAPDPVRNADLMAVLRSRLAPGPLKRFSLPTPAPLLRVGAVALRTDPALGLTGRHATSSVLGPAGFRFRHPELGAAVAAITS